MNGTSPKFRDASCGFVDRDAMGSLNAIHE